MLTPDYLEASPEAILELYEEFTLTILYDMARRIAKMGFISESTLQQTAILKEAGMFQKDIMQELAKLLNKSNTETKNLFTDAAVTTLKSDDKIYKAGGKKPLPFSQSEPLKQILLANINKTNGNLQNLTRTTAITTQKDFITSVSKANTLVSSGAMSYTQIIKNIVYDLSDKGITSVTYNKNGKTIYHKLDVAVRRAILTGVNQTSAQIQIARLEELGWDLVETTAHMGARPLHQEWQGKIFSYSGKSSKYASFRASTGYGTGEGLCGWNCRHNFYPYLEGTTPAYKDLDYYNNATVSYKGKDIDYYEATQIQRQYERNIRESKRKLVVIQGAANGSNQNPVFRSDFAKQSKNLKDKEDRLKDFTKQTGLSRQKDREQAYNFNKSIAQKSRYAGRR